jgi:hypothetical protein
MSFKIKDGVRIGTTDVFDNSGTLLVNAPTATKWATARTITLGGDLSGNVNIDGSANVTLTATIAADSVALGTDTTGNYIATIAGGTGISVSGSGSENAAATVSLSHLGIQNLTDPNADRILFWDDSASATAWLTLGSNLTITDTTISATDTNTTYDISAASTTGGANLTLTAGGSGSGTDSVKFASGGIVTVSQTDANTITITGTEADTLATVTGREATTSTAVSFTNSTSSTNTTTGAVVVTGGVGIGGAVNIGGAVVIGGNLTVNGTTTTVNSTTTTLDDPIITLGGDAAPSTDDNKDRGVEFRWHNGTTAKLGFFGYDDSTGKFTFIPDATNSSEVFSGTKGTLDANIEWDDILNKPSLGTGSVTSVALSLPNTFTVSGSPVTSSGTLTAVWASQTANTFLAAPNGSAGTPTFRSILAADIPTLNQNTTGTAANVTGTVAIANGGTGATTAPNARTNLGATTLGSNLFTATNPSAVTFIRVNADNTISTLSAADFRTAISAGTVTSIATQDGITGGTITASGTIGLTGQALALHNLSTSGIIARTGSGTVAARTLTAGSNVTITNGDGISGNPTISASFTEADTLATVTARGNTTDNGITLIDGASTGTFTDVTVIAVSGTTEVNADTFATATYRSAKYTIQITQSTNYQISEILVLHNGSQTTMTEYAVLESNGVLANFTSDVSSGNCRLRIALSVSTAATVRILKTYFTV